MKLFIISLSIFTTAMLSIGAPTITNNLSKPACCATELKAGSVSANSIYQLASIWTNDANQSVKLSTLRGKPQLVTMFFAQCVSACPILVHDLRRIESALPLELRSKVGFVLISFDTQRDDPEVLNTYRHNQKLPDNWTLLTASPDDVMEIAALLGVKFRKEATGQYAHSNIITVLDPEGEVLMQQVGLNRDPAPVVAALTPLLRK